LGQILVIFKYFRIFFGGFSRFPPRLGLVNCGFYVESKINNG